jgi:calcineurin-like phosphoesterase family protein
MSHVYVIADLHICHEKLITRLPKYREFSTIEEHNEAIVENCNRVATKRDLLIILGDLCFGSGCFDYLKRLKAGTKKLVMGNHDTSATSRYAEIFDSIHGALERDHWILTHIPVHPMQKPRYRGNVHGHLHRSNVLLEDGTIDPWYKCVSCEQVSYTPVDFHELIRAK